MSYIKPYNRQFNQYNKQFNQSKNRSFNKQYNKSCNKIDQLHQIYSNQKIKQILIDYIYDNTNIRLYNYKILSSKNDLNLINSTKYIITPNYHGFNYLLVFMKNKDRYYSYLVDRQTLVFNKNNVNIDNVKIIPIEVNLDNKIYDGTILDGIYHFNNNDKYFIINDVYKFRGEDLSNDIIKYKLINLELYLKHYNKNNSNDNIKISVNTYYDFNNIKEAYDNFRYKYYNIQIRGLCLYPYISGTKLIYIFDNFKNNKIQINTNYIIDKNDKVDKVNNDNIVNSDNKISDEVIKNNSNEKYKRIPKNKNIDIYLNFEIRKTEIDDVYKLFLVYPIDKNNNKFKTSYIDYACIPDIKTSKLCKEIFANVNKKILSCKYDNIRNKWIPEKISEMKYPNKLSDLDKYFN